MLWRRLAKWLGILIAVVAVLGLVVVWPILGVNPFEGSVDRLWLVTSNKVDFFVRFPPLNVIDNEPLVKTLEQHKPYSLTKLRDEITRLAAQIARDVNPQIPMGLVQIDIEEDFLTKESALGGIVERDFQNPRLDKFVFVARVPFYARFLSALKRGFVRDRVQGLDIELVNGLYFRVRVPPVTSNALRPYRSPIPRPGGDGVFYLARVKDVVILSDSDVWIEHALQGGIATLQADAWFESEYMANYRGGNRAELFVRPALTQRLMYQHGKSKTGILGVIWSMLPPNTMGELTVHAEARGANQIAFDLSNILTTDGFNKLPPHLRTIYDGERGDPRYDLSENGIGRFIPKNRTFGAAVIHAKPEHLVEMIVQVLDPITRSEADDLVRDVSRRRGRNYASFGRLLSTLVEDFADTHLLVIHRPSFFEGKRFDTYAETKRVPAFRLSFTLVSAVKDSANVDQIREKFFQHLEYMGMKSMGPHKSGKFHMADLNVRMGDEDLVRPAYGGLSGGKRFFVLSTSVEGAEAVFEASENPDQRLIGEGGVGALAARLPQTATAAFVFDGPTVKKALFDGVGLWAMDRMRPMDYLIEYRGKNKITDEEAQGVLDDYIYTQYPIERQRYVEALAPLDPIDLVVGSVALGVGAEKKVQAAAVARIRPPE